MDKKAQQLPGRVPGSFGKKKDDVQTAEEEDNASSTKRKRTRKRCRKPMSLERVLRYNWRRRVSILLN
uniref:Uncharacterized protein n=1 Tax=Ditylenchus dipsaci TaxID=166011 RepID=A0A915CTB8_9BILA